MTDDNLRIEGTKPSGRRNWIDANYHRTWTSTTETPYARTQNYHREIQERESEQSKPVKSEDKLEQRGPLSQYQVEGATFEKTPQEIAYESCKEYKREERRMAKQSMLFRTYFKGGIGYNFDELA